MLIFKNIGKLLHDWLVKRPSLTGHDELLSTIVFMLMMLGVVMVYSASIALPDATKYAAYDNSHFLLRQLVSVGIGIAAGLVVYRIPIAIFERHAMSLMLMALFLLALVLVPGIGKGVNGARRWLPLGVMNFQPSEFMKLAMVFYAASFAVRRHAVLHSLTRGFGPLALVVFVTGILLMLEPDMGALIVIVAIALGILFLGGFNAIWFGGLSAMLVGAFSLMIYFSPWRRARFFAYLDPWDETNVLGKAYQLSHSLIAYGRGGITGVGLGASVEKLHYLPEAHTDFVMAVIGEELGLIGVAAVLLLFYIVVRRCMLIGRHAIELERHFAGLVAQGIAIWLGIQALINVAVTTGAVPTKGLTLPFVSYGGSGILLNCIAIAVVLRIDHEIKVLRFGPGI